MSSSQEMNTEVKNSPGTHISVELTSIHVPLPPTYDFGRELNEKEKKLFELVKHGNSRQVEDFLKAHLHNQYKPDSAGTSSHSVVLDDSITPANDSLNINKKDSECHSVLQLAVFRGDVKIVKLLLDAGCTDPCALDLAGALRYNEVLSLFIERLPKDNSQAEESSNVESHDIDTTNNSKGKNSTHRPNISRLISYWRARSARNTSLPRPETFVSDTGTKEEDIRRMLKAAIDAEDHNQTEQLAKRLKDKGLIIKCACPKHRAKNNTNSNVLQGAKERLEICHIISSPLHILTTAVPLKTALDVHQHLKNMAYWHSENREEFLQLSKRSSKFAIDLLETCKNDDEAKLLFTIDPKPDQSQLPNVDKTFKYELLLDAVGRLQKEFVSHPTCQLVVTKLWYGTYYTRWSDWSEIERFFHIVWQVMLTPLMFIMFTFKGGRKKEKNMEEINQQEAIENDTNGAVKTTEAPVVPSSLIQTAPSSLQVTGFAPPSEAPVTAVTDRQDRLMSPVAKIKDWIRRHSADCLGSPFNRFIYAVASYLFFLFTAVSKQYVDRAKNWPYPSVDGYDLIIGIYIVGHILKLLTDFFAQPHMSYTRLWWITYDALTMSFFVIGASTFFIGFGNETANWRAALLSQGFYSIGITLACMRTLQWLHLSSILGPLVISFSEMATVIKRLLVIFAIVVVSFSTGIYTVYKNFHTDYEEDDRDDTFFRSYVKTLKILFWAMFGKGEANYASIPDNYQYLLGNVTVTSELQEHFTVIVGYVLWSFFHIAVVIVLLNMLIAVMTNYYQVIQNNGDTEWKFACTKLRLYYIEKSNMFPPPFNISFMLVKFMKWLYQKCPKSINRSSDQTDHKVLIKELNGRYRQEKELAKIRARTQHREITSSNPLGFAAQNGRDRNTGGSAVNSAECYV